MSPDCRIRMSVSLYEPKVCGAFKRQTAVVLQQEAKEARTNLKHKEWQHSEFGMYFCLVQFVYPFVLENCADEDMAASDAVISAYGVQNQALIHLISLGSWPFWRDELQKVCKLRWERDIQAMQRQGVWRTEKWAACFHRGLTMEVLQPYWRHQLIKTGPMLRITTLSKASQHKIRWHHVQSNISMYVYFD